MKPERAPLDGPRVVALRYERGDLPAPRVSAKGSGALAERILELAHQHDVPVRADPDLLELLAACELGDEIPGELYRAVAELLVFLQRLNRSGDGPGDGPGNDSADVREEPSEAARAERSHRAADSA